MDVRFSSTVMKMFWDPRVVMYAQRYEYTKPAELYTLRG